MIFRRFTTTLALFSILVLHLKVPAQSLFNHAAATSPSSSSSCAPCAAKSQNGINSDPISKLASLGRRTQISPLTPAFLSTFDGEAVNFVHTATGQLAFTVSDLSTTGVLPVMFQRVYASSRQEDTGLGTGWSFVFDDRIVIKGNTALLTSGAGPTIAFRRDESSQRFVLQTEQALPYQAFEVKDGNLIVEQNAGLTRFYKKLGESYRLSQVKDSNDNQIRIDYDSRGNLARMTSSGGTLTLRWSEGRNARLLSVRSSVGQEVNFKQTSHLLRGVVDPTGAQWAYEYKEERLTRATDPVGRVLLRARYDRTHRVVAAGDAAGLNHYDYAAAPISRRTTVTDPLGATTVYEHTERGALLSVSDDEGPVMQIEYGAQNRPARKWSAFSGESRFIYDAQNRPLRQSAGGEEKVYTYDGQGRIATISNGANRTEYTRDARGNIITAQSNQAETSYHAVVNSRGQVVSLKSEAGRDVSFEYDGDGNETAYTDSIRGRFETERDAAGRITAQRFPSGLTKFYEYNSQGVLKRLSTNSGHSVTFERDASGMLTGLVTGNGSIRATRDQTGRIIAVTDANMKVRRFAYDARGALTEYVDARGRRISLKYDSQGRPQLVSFSDGRRLKLSYDGTRQRTAVWQRPNDAPLMETAHGRNVSMLSWLVQPQSADCFFGEDGFLNPMIRQGGEGGGSFGCEDPLTGFDVYGGGLIGVGSGLSYEFWYNGPFGIGETPEQCAEREQKACAAARSACVKRAAGGMILAGIGCAALTLGLGLGLCAVAAGAGSALYASACDDDYNACILAIPNKCR